MSIKFIIILLTTIPHLFRSPDIRHLKIFLLLQLPSNSELAIAEQFKAMGWKIEEIFKLKTFQTHWQVRSNKAVNFDRMIKFFAKRNCSRWAQSKRLLSKIRKAFAHNLLILFNHLQMSGLENLVIVSCRQYIKC